MNRLKHFRFLLFFVTISMFSQEKLKIEYSVLPSYQTNDKNVQIINLPSTFELIIDGNESEYIYIERIDNSEKEHFSSSVVAVFQEIADGVLYKNTSSKTYIENKKFDNKTFLIKDSLPKIDWKIIKDTKNIAGFSAFKATAKIEDGMEIIAWYAPKLNLKTGPAKFWGLPGLILEVETTIEYEGGDKDNIKYTAVKVETIHSNKKTEIPLKGEILTQIEFDTMQKKHFEKQREMYGGGVDKD